MINRHATSRLLVIAVAALAAAAVCPNFARATALADVPEVSAQGYQLVYREALPLSLGGTVTYDVDNSATVPTTWDRVAYYLELQSTAGGSTPQFAYVSFNRIAGMTAANRTGIPTTASGEIYQQTVVSMNVASNVAGIVTGTGLANGNIEFWPTDYSTANAASIPNANAGTYDFGDSRTTTGTYGSMQIHNHDVDGAGAGTAGQTLLAFNSWGAAGNNDDLGIGNRAATDTDWTFATNSATYSIRNLEVLVRVPEPSGAVALTALALAGLQRRRSRRPAR